jgi:hypothetical protein
MRTHRTRLQRLVYSDVFRCSKCGQRSRRVHTSLAATLTFFFSRHTHCIRCGTERVHRMQKRDRIDSVSKNLASRLLHLSGAPLNKCIGCRLQYYDWRTPEPSNLK